MRPVRSTRELVIGTGIIIDALTLADLRGLVGRALKEGYPEESTVRRGDGTAVHVLRLRWSSSAPTDTDD